MTTSAARGFRLALLLGALPCYAGAQAPRVPLAAHDIMRGVVLASSDIGYLGNTSVPSTTTTPAKLEPAAATDTLVGWTTRRLIAAGEPLRAPAVAPPQLVKSGDLVEVSYQSEGVSITMRGRATRSAAL
ncbi:MAG: flagellar basal body P-ring formation chaperone FlgA, partial [bacterium]